ncbi:MAG: class I SAM-dependent methyltransferase [Gemmatimonadales bacterium]
MNLEREYYENDDFWSNESLGEHDSGRASALIEEVPESVATVLELGCGNGIFINSLRASARKFEQIVGLDRSLSALKYVQGSKIGASIDKVPFGDSAFDMVAAFEVIEHLPVQVYASALSEICRLSRRYAMVSVPYKQDLRQSLIECPSCFGQFNPDYHMHSFDEAVLENLLVPFGFSCVKTFTIAPYKQFRGIAKFRAMTRRRTSAENPFPTSIPCPMCGFYLKPAASGGTSMPTPDARSDESGIKPLIKKLWPREQSYVWVAALYERQTGHQ